jgi:hypothetical protein
VRARGRAEAAMTSANEIATIPRPA